MQLARLFEPKTTAIFGVSFSNPFHPANVIYNKNHLRQKTKAYCINPNGGALYGEKVYPSIRDIPEKVDLAILAIRAEFVAMAKWSFVLGNSILKRPFVVATFCFTKFLK